MHFDSGVHIHTALDPKLDSPPARPTSPSSHCDSHPPPPQDGSEFYHLADTFARKFEEAYATIRKGSEAGERDPERVPTIDERMRLSYDLFKLNDADLGRTLTMIEGDGDGGPSVLSKTRGQDEVMINVDLLRPRLFHDVHAFVESCLENASGNKKRKLKEAA